MPRALADLERIEAYHRQFSDETAARVVEAIRTSTLRLINHPLSAPYIKGLNARKLTVLRYPYLVFYRVGDDRLRILRVHHMAENWLPR